jgi:hypothetical protein
VKQLDEHVLDPRSEPAITLDGPEVLNMAPNTQSLAAFHYSGTATTTTGTSAELTEVEPLKQTQADLAEKVTDLSTSVQMLAQDVHDLRKQLCAAIQHGMTIGVAR